jgi:hypothetical protein
MLVFEQYAAVTNLIAAGYSRGGLFKACARSKVDRGPQWRLPFWKSFSGIAIRQRIGSDHLCDDAFEVNVPRLILPFPDRLLIRNPL